MFSKNTEKLESFIGANAQLKGDIDSKGTLRIDGKVEGKVNADWVILGEKALINGDVTAKGIVVGGRIDGNLTAKEIIEIKSKGHVQGDINTYKLTIIEGGVFEGKSSMHKGDINIVEFQAKGL